jgi:hypothetical protein
MIFLPLVEARSNKQLPLMLSALINLVPLSGVKFATPSVQFAVMTPRQTLVSAAKDGVAQTARLIIARANFILIIDSMTPCLIQDRIVAPRVVGVALQSFPIAYT